MLSIALVAPLVAACTSADATTDSATTGEVDASSSPAMSSSASGTAADGTTSDDGGPVTGTTDTPTTTTPPADSGPPPPPEEPFFCSLEALDPAADPTMVIEYGDGEDQIPTEIGEALLRNCGCHYTDDLPPGTVDYMSKKQAMATFADFHATFQGIFPMGYEDEPAWAAIERRVVFHDPLPMPSFGCDVEGEDGVITSADLALFTEWFAAGAPDGATWAPASTGTGGETTGTGSSTG